MRILRSRGELSEELGTARRAGLTIGLVPTMGALHEGHLSLIRAAREECDRVVVSLFVNPTQFGPGEDFESYPRDEQRDRQLAEAAGADLLYAPSAEHVYPEGFSTQVEVTGLTDVLCGAPDSRGSAHFRGVTTVVCKLLCAVGPDRAYFGQKDAQQVAVIRRMVRDLEIPVEIRAMPIVREADGLAMSSRNTYLDPAERRQAQALSRALRRAESELEAGVGLERALSLARATLADAGLHPEYLEARDPESLSAVSELNGRPVLIALAVPVGKARLIDNTVVGEVKPSPVVAQGGRSR